jgi:hypothetical protein
MEKKRMEKGRENSRDDARQKRNDNNAISAPPDGTGTTHPSLASTHHPSHHQRNARK